MIAAAAVYEAARVRAEKIYEAAKNGHGDDGDEVAMKGDVKPVCKTCYGLGWVCASEEDRFNSIVHKKSCPDCRKGEKQ